MSADALSGNREPRPVSWIITALCFIGAQFVIVPFLIFLALASDGALIEAPGGFGAAAALLVGLSADLCATLNVVIAGACAAAWA